MLQEHPSAAEQGWFTRERLLLFALLAATTVGIIVCYRLAAPFLPALAWALALAVVGHPIHVRVARRIQSADLASAISVAIVAVGLIAPAVFVTQQVFRQAGEAVDKVQTKGGAERLTGVLEKNSTVAPVLDWIEQNFAIRDELKNLTETIRGRIGPFLRGSLWGVIQILIALFALFYFFRDRADVLRSIQSLVPLSQKEVVKVFDRVRSMVYATIYGTLVVAGIQGALGGLMFWILGLPGPLLWGVVMGLLAIVPILGAFIIWVPAAIFLAMEGSWAKALILAVWGTVVVGLIDNLLYPILVGKEMRLHTLPVFIAILGGLYVFGASGLILGPVALAVTLALIDILRRRTEAGRPAEEPR
jgi:predicted PurR-regulated permease PerM